MREVPRSIRIWALVGAIIPWLWIPLGSYSFVRFETGWLFPIHVLVMVPLLYAQDLTKGFPESWSPTASLVVGSVLSGLFYAAIGTVAWLLVLAEKRLVSLLRHRRRDPA